LISYHPLGHAQREFGVLAGRNRSTLFRGELGVGLPDVPKGVALGVGHVGLRFVGADISLELRCIVKLLLIDNVTPEGEQLDAYQ
jgi:hypothetical protein